MKFKYVKKQQEDNKYAELKAITRKNFYAVGIDENGKSYITVFRGVMFNEARRMANKWARANNLYLECVRAFSGQ